MAGDGIEVTNDEAAQRYQARIDGALSLIQYERRGDRIVYLHTEVPEALEGRGLAHELALLVSIERRRHQPRGDPVQLGAGVAQTGHLDHGRVTQVQSRGQGSRLPRELVELDQVPIWVFEGGQPEAAPLVVRLLDEADTGRFEPRRVGVYVVGE